MGLVPFDSCMACAVEASSRANTWHQALDKQLHDYLATNGKEVVTVEGDGYCMVRSFWAALCIEGNEYTFEELLNLAITELKNFGSFYNLWDTTKCRVELDRYAANGNYMCDAVDSILPALVNRTAAECTIHQIDASGNLSQLVLSPTAPPLHKIELAYYRHRLHYNCVYRKRKLPASTLV